MTESGTDYSDYLKHSGTIVSLASLMAGFVFTSITLFLTQLQPEQLYSALMQVVLLFLGFLFCIWLYVAAGFATSGIFLVRRSPPLTKQAWLLTIMI